MLSRAEVILAARRSANPNPTTNPNPNPNPDPNPNPNPNLTLTNPNPNAARRSAEVRRLMGLPAKLRADDGSQAQFEAVSNPKPTPNPTPTPNPNPNPNPNQAQFEEVFQRFDPDGSKDITCADPNPNPNPNPNPSPKPSPNPSPNRNGSKDVTFAEFASYFAQHGLNRGARCCSPPAPRPQITRT